MSGHSKWATIKHAKGQADAKRGQMFTKLIKEITIATRMGGKDPHGNPRLRTAILKARASSMPNSNIENAIKKGAGELEGPPPVELTYEARLGEAALMIEVLTDNRNRAAADVRNILTRHGAELAKEGSVSRLFQRKGVIDIDAEKYTEDQIMEIALDAGAEDIQTNDGVIEVTTTPADFEKVLDAINAKQVETMSAEVDMISDAEVTLDKEGTSKMMKLVDKLEENEDVQNVYHNVAVPDDYEPGE
jgi:YebC/PmpR family DNA-binding regulatory protein